MLASVDACASSAVIAHDARSTRAAAIQNTIAAAAIAPLNAGRRTIAPARLRGNAGASMKSCQINEIRPCVVRDPLTMSSSAWAEPLNLCSGLHTANAAGVRVDVQTIAASEANQGDAGFMRQVDRERGGRRHGDDDGDAAEPGLLDDLERDASADRQRMRDVLRRRQQQGPNRLVDGIVPADVFSRRQ